MCPVLAERCRLTSPVTKSGGRNRTCGETTYAPEDVRSLGLLLPIGRPYKYLGKNRRIPICYARDREAGSVAPSGWRTTFSLPRTRDPGPSLLWTGPAVVRRQAATMARPPLMFGPLREKYPDRIIVGDRTFFLKDGMKCNYPPGTPLQVVYTEQNGRCEAESITPTSRDR